MSDEKRILIYDDEGNVKENIPYDAENVLRPLNSTENMAVIPTGIKLASFADASDSIIKQNIPKTLRTEKKKSHDADIVGPTRHTIPRRIGQTSEVVGKVILGGQHAFGQTLDGLYYGAGSTVFYNFNYPNIFDELKLTRGDNFQILNTNISLMDGIYKFNSHTDGQIKARKILGATGGETFGFFSYGFSAATGEGFHMIRLQELSGSVYGASASVEGCGVYSYSENLRQSRYKVSTVDPDGDVGTSNSVVHDGGVYKFGNSSARFPTTGSTGSHLLVAYDDDFTPTESGGSVYFRLSFWVKFASSSPTKDMVLVSQANNNGTGVYQLKFTHSPRTLTFSYSTNASGSDLDNTFSASILATLTDWNHVQVEVAPYKEVRIYINGTLTAVDAIGPGSEEIFVNVEDAPFVIGAKDDGSLPFEGNIDELEMLWAASTVANHPNIYFMAGPTGSTAATGSTFDLPTGGVTGTTFTSLLFNMNGPSGCKLFTEDGTQSKEVTGNVVGYDDDRRILLVSNYGISIGSFATSKGFVKGYDEGLTNGTPGTTANSLARHPFLGEIIGITAQGANVTNLKRVLGYQQETNNLRDMFYVGMTGNSGSSGDFKNLFGVAGACAAFGSRTLSFYPSDYEMVRTNKALLSTGVGGVSLSESMVYFDLDGVSFAVTEAQLSAFQADCQTYREIKENDVSEKISAIYNATNLQDLSASSNTKVIDVDYSPFIGTKKLPTTPEGRNFDGAFVFKGT